MTTPPYADGMTDRTLDLSDAANEALYPDVEHPEPAELPADALAVPPPLVQQEGNLLGIVRAYASGQADWDATKQALIDFDYQQMPPRTGQPAGSSRGEWYTDVEADVGTSAPPDTWSQLQEAADAGLLTSDEFNEVLAARAQRGQEAAAAAAEKEQKAQEQQPATE